MVERTGRLVMSHDERPKTWVQQANAVTVDTGVWRSTNDKRMDCMSGAFEGLDDLTSTASRANQVKGHKSPAPSGFHRHPTINHPSRSPSPSTIYSTKTIRQQTDSFHPLSHPSPPPTVSPSLTASIHSSSHVRAERTTSSLSTTTPLHEKPALPCSLEHEWGRYTDVVGGGLDGGAMRGRYGKESRDEGGLGWRWGWGS